MLKGRELSLPISMYRVDEKTAVLVAIFSLIAYLPVWFNWYFKVQLFDQVTKHLSTVILSVTAIGHGINGMA